MMKRVLTIALILVIACTQDPTHREAKKQDAAKPAEPAPNAQQATTTLPPADWAEAQARIKAQVDSVDRKLRRVANLSSQEKTRLKRDVNAIQIARARQLGIRPGGSVEQLAASNRLVKLADTTAYWTLRPLNFSVPYVTPSTEAMLAEIGERFQQKLDSLGIPKYRLDITSVLRTPDKQAALRRANSNASRVESAHEFGTTVDIAYRRYAPPVKYPDDEGAAPLDARAAFVRDSLMIHTGTQRATEMMAVLGRVLQEMQREGKLMVRMERRQTVYHITVARSLPKRRVTGI